MPSHSPKPRTPNARHHAVHVGVAFTRLYVTGADNITIELRDWNGAEERTIGIRQLLATVNYEHMAHQLLHDDRQVNEAAVQLYLDLFAQAIHSRADQLRSQSLTKTPFSLDVASTTIKQGTAQINPGSPIQFQAAESVARQWRNLDRHDRHSDPAYILEHEYCPPAFTFAFFTEALERTGWKFTVVNPSQMDTLLRAPVQQQSDRAKEAASGSPGCTIL